MLYVCMCALYIYIYTCIHASVCALCVYINFPECSAASRQISAGSALSHRETEAEFCLWSLSFFSSLFPCWTFPHRHQYLLFIKTLREESFIIEAQGSYLMIYLPGAFQFIRTIILRMKLVMFNHYYQLDRIQYHHGNKPVGMSVSVSKLDWGRRLLLNVDSTISLAQVSGCVKEKGTRALYFLCFPNGRAMLSGTPFSHCSIFPAGMDCVFQ